MNLIDRDILIKELKEATVKIPLVEKNRDMFFHDSGYNCAIWSAIFLAEKQPVVNQWMPCSEELPPKPLFSWKGYIVQKNNVEEPFSAYWDGEKWIDDEGNEIEGITAWQPLPKPYKEKENEM